MKNNDDLDVRESIKIISDKIEQSEKFAEMLLNTLEKSKTADVAIRKIIVNLIKKDSETKEELENIIMCYNKKEAKNFLKLISGKIFFGMWTIATIVITAWLTSKFK